MSELNFPSHDDDWYWSWGMSDDQISMCEHYLRNTGGAEHRTLEDLTEEELETIARGLPPKEHDAEEVYSESAAKKARRDSVEALESLMEYSNREHLEALWELPEAEEPKMLD